MLIYVFWRYIGVVLIQEEVVSKPLELQQGCKWDENEALGFQTCFPSQELFYVDIPTHRHTAKERDFLEILGMCLKVYLRWRASRMHPSLTPQQARAHHTALQPQASQQGIARNGKPNTGFSSANLSKSVSKDMHRKTKKKL